MSDDWPGEFPLPPLIGEGSQEIKEATSQIAFNLLIA